MIFFTEDEHYGHTNIIRFCDRPFENVQEMDTKLIRRHNEVVEVEDTVVHAGDFAWCKREKEAQAYVKQLNGRHVFIRGSHDRWLPKSAPTMWMEMIEGKYVIVCHYFLCLQVLSYR